MSSKIKVALVGSEGRMGQEIVALAKKDSNFEISPLDLSKSKSEIDVVIDFSSPQGALQGAKWCVKNNVPLVSGTTGFNIEEEREFRGISKKIPLFWSPNMSIGLNAMAEALTHFAHNFSASKVTIEDVHHINKKDKPSGTAKFLYNVIKQNVSKSTKVEDPTSIREGEVFGTHKVTFYGNGECITFHHEAQSRAIFAAGALRAAHWITEKEPGFYQMRDLLK